MFGRRGARPFNFDEMLRMLRTNDGKGEWFTVSDAPATEPRSPSGTRSAARTTVAGLLLGLVIALAGYHKTRRRSVPVAAESPKLRGFGSVRSRRFIDHDPRFQ